MVSHQLVYYGFRLSHQKRSPLQSHKDKAYGTLLPGICIRTASSITGKNWSRYRGAERSKLFFTLISKLCQKIVKRFYRMSDPPNMLVSAMSFNDWGILWAVPSIHCSNIWKKFGEIDFFFSS